MAIHICIYANPTLQRKKKKKEKWRLVGGKEVLTYRGAETGLGGTSMQPWMRNCLQQFPRGSLQA